MNTEKNQHLIPLSQMNAGNRGIIRAIQGGRHFEEKLNALGIYISREITKLSGSFLGGPVVIKINNSEIALGRGMACRIFAEPLPRDENNNI